MISTDKIQNYIRLELQRQQSNLELIASENFVSTDVLKAQGSILTNKYAEGYISRRYYGGCKFIDEIEHSAISNAKQLFSCEYANVQPHSGSQANQAVFLALINPGDTVLAMDLNSGGHLTHGAKPNLSGKWFNIVPYYVRNDNFLIDYDEIESLAKKHRPKLIIAGYSSYPRALDFARFRTIADQVGAYLLADIAHIAGLVATGRHMSPLPYAHVVTTTTHKTLRGPRGGMILTNDAVISKKINSSIFPGLQGGPLMHVIAAKAIAFAEALTPEFNNYIDQVLLNARALATSLQNRGYNTLTGGTENHMVIVDLTTKNLSGKYASDILEEAYITCNKQAIPFDAAGPAITSGIRLGAPACTTRGFRESEFKMIGEYIVDILDQATRVYNNGDQDNNSNHIYRLNEVIAQVKHKVKLLCQQFPLYAGLTIDER